MAAAGILGDAKIQVLLTRLGYFLWGDENRGVMVAYNHFRNYFDAGRGFSEENDFDEMRRYHIIQNIGLLRYFYKPNIIYSAEYYTAAFNKMVGSGSAADARRRLGLGTDGGTYQQVTLQVTYNF